MTDAAATRFEQNRRLKILLVDADPIFRIGLRTGLSEFSDLQVVAEADTDTAALQVLRPPTENRTTASYPIDLVVLDLNLGRNHQTGLVLCQQLKAQHPDLPVLLLSTTPDPTLLAAAFQTGTAGYCPKGIGITELVAALRQIAVGQPVWVEGMQTIARSVTTTQPPVQSLTPGWLANFRYRLRASGLRQIEATLAGVNAQLRDEEISIVNRAVLAGQRRELRVARWLVNRLLTPAATIAPSENEVLPDVGAVARSTPQLRRSISTSLPDSELMPDSGDRLLVGRSQTDLRTTQSDLCDTLFAQLQSSLQNLTDVPLEIDILREEKKRELLLTLLQKLEAVLDELRSQVQPAQLADKQAVILQDLWQATTTDFLGKYYTLRVGRQEVEVVPVLLRDAPIVQDAILSKIPLVLELLAALLFQAPLTIDNVAYPIETPEAMARAEVLLQNLILQVGNAVMQPFLNRFANVEAVKQAFYDRRLLSIREIERFRNSLSWKYRVERYLNEPKAIFESQFRLWVFGDRGITTMTIYAPRSVELEQLSGIQFAVTLGLETRDAIAPRLRSAISFLGSGVVYVLTEVVGRGIGLIGRGILKGIGNALQDNRFDRRSDR